MECFIAERSVSSNGCLGELFRERTPYGPTRLSPSSFKKTHASFVQDMGSLSGQLEWSNFMNICRNHRVATDETPIAFGDIVFLALLKLLETDASVLLLVQKCEADNLREAIQLAVSRIGIQVHRKLPSDTVQSRGLALYVSTPDEWSEHIHLNVALRVNKELFKPYIIVCGASCVMRGEAMAFPMYSHQSDKGVAVDSWGWMSNLHKRWDAFTNNDIKPIPGAVAKDIDSFIMSLGLKNEQSSDAARLAVWNYVWAKLASADGHRFCTVTTTSRVLLDVPEELSALIAEAPMKDFMGVYAQIGRPQTESRVRCLMQLQTLSTPTMLDLFTNGFCWLGGYSASLGASWLPKNGSVEVLRFGKRHSKACSTFDFQLLSSTARVDACISAALNVGSMVICDSQVSPAHRSMVKRFSVLDPIQTYDGKDVVFVGIMKQVSFDALLRILHKARSVTLLLDQEELTNGMSDDDYLVFNQQSLSVGLAQGRGRPIGSLLSVLYNGLRKKEMFDSSRLPIEFDFYASVIAGADTVSTAHEMAASLSVRALKGRMFAAIGANIELPFSLKPTLSRGGV